MANPKAVVKNSELLDKFSLIQLARGGGKSKPILQTIKVEGWKKENKLGLTACNRLAYAHVELEAKITGKDFMFCADPLVFQILATFPSDAEITIEVGEKEIVIRYGKKTHSIMTIPADDFEARPETGVYAPQNLTPLVQAFEVSQIAAAEDAHRPALQCFNMSPSNGAVLTADGMQFMKVGELSLQGENALPRHTVIKDFGPLLKYIAGDEEAQSTFGEYSGFYAPTLGAELIVQQVNAKLFDLEKLFVAALAKKELARIVIPTHILKPALTVCRIYEMRGLRSGAPNTAVLNIKENEARMSTTIQGLSNMDEPLEEVTIERLEGEEQTLRFSAQLLAELLEVIEEESIVLSILEGGVKSPFVVRLPSNENCVYLQMPTQ